MVLAAIGPQGAGNPQAQPQPAPQGGPVAAAGATSGGVSGLRAMIHQNPNGIAPNPAAANLNNDALTQFLPGARPPARPRPGPDMFMPSVGGPPPPAPAVPPLPAGPAAAPQPAGGIAQPVAAPGGVPPPVVGGPGAAVPVQGSPGDRPRPVARGAMAQQQQMIDEIEQQYGQPNTWGQNGAQSPPHSVIQRYWRAVRGGRAINGYDYAADGTFVPIGGAPQRGGGGGGRGGGSSNASANATQVLAETVPQMENAAEYILGSNVFANMAGQVPGAQMLGVTGFNNARSSLVFGTAAIMHSLSGATTTEREFQRYVDAFLPSANDMDNVRRYKLNSLMMIVRSIQARARGGAVTDDAMAPVRLQMLRQQRELLGLQNGGQIQAGSQAGSTPRPATGGGWGSAGGMSTQDILNGLRR